MMPEIGEIRKGTEIGLKSKDNMIWVACIDCGQPRWVRRSREKQKPTLCRSCSGKRQATLRGDKTPGWKGGRIKHSDGYILIWLSPDDFFYPMANSKSYVLEHRLIVAKALGRCLLPWEIVHHKGDKYPIGSTENRQDNRYPENLELTIRRNHIQEHNKGYSDGYAKGLQDGRLKQIQELKARISELESLLKLAT